MDELLITILIKYPEARFIEAIPTIIIRNISKINKFELYRKAYEYRLINKIGYLLDVAFILAKKTKHDLSQLKELLDQFKEQKDEKTQYFSTFNDKKFLEETTPEIMKKWYLRGRFSIQDFHKEAYL